MLRPPESKFYLDCPGLAWKVTWKNMKNKRKILFILIIIIPLPDARTVRVKQSKMMATSGRKTLACHAGRQDRTRHTVIIFTGWVDPHRWHVDMVTCVGNNNNQHVGEIVIAGFHKTWRTETVAFVIYYCYFNLLRFFLPREHW